MKKLFSFLLIAIMFLHGCGSSEAVSSGDLPPMLILHDKNYVASYMPVDELPDGYEYIGELAKEQANDTGLEGCKMYAVMGLDSPSDIYVYQECGTPIDENTIDMTKLQWAYMQWIVSPSEK